MNDFAAQSAWMDQPCRVPSQPHRQRATQRQQQLTKPVGALGRLETLAAELAGLQSRDRPCAERVPVIVFAGDHGVVGQGVSAYPAEVTEQMLHNFANGGAAISVLTREMGLPLRVIDVGTLAIHPIDGVDVDKVCHGTRDLSVAAAMSEAELDHALGAGRRAVRATMEQPSTTPSAIGEAAVTVLESRPADTPDLLVFGEMGIGNTTAASALACALDGLSSADLVGAGTGLDASRIGHKQAVIERALAVHRAPIATAGSPAREALRRVGGFEIAAIAGAIVAAAQQGLPVLVDGFIVSVAALAAVRINPEARPWLLFSHRSAERGHGHVLDALHADPLLHLDLRLGEGSGAALAVPLLRLACALHNGMATFAEAAVSGREATSP